MDCFSHNPAQYLDIVGHTSHVYPHRKAGQLVIEPLMRERIVVHDF